MVLTFHLAIFRFVYAREIFENGNALAYGIKLLLMLAFVTMQYIVAANVNDKFKLFKRPLKLRMGVYTVVLSMVVTAWYISKLSLR